ncbi:11783_t:CDS:1, partial [Racocetra fulgida]
MSLTLFIIRHGERVDLVDPNFIYTSPTPYDTPLTPKGKRQAKRTGAYIHDIQLETVKDINHQRKVEYIIYTSPFLRTVETAIGIAEGISSNQPNLPIDSLRFRIEPALADWHYHKKAIPNSIIDSRVKELCLLNQQYQDSEQDQQQSQLCFKVDFEYAPIATKLPVHPEGIMDALARCSNAFEKITDPFMERLCQDPLKDIVLILVTHGWCFNAIQNACSKGSSSWFDVRYCAVTRAKWVPKGENSEDIYIEDTLDDNSSTGKWIID